MENNQKQVAGKDSTLVQAHVINVYNGITEQRAREISKETMQQVLQQCTVESGKVAKQRIEDFQETVLPRIASIEKDFVSFSDPAFQVLYKKAQISAACSGKDLDYGMLSELIAHRINNKDDTKKKASIEKAVEIIDKIDEDALCGLTMVYAICQFSPVPGNISHGLSIINSLYAQIQYMNLPNVETGWIDNLDILSAARIQSVTNFKKFEEFISEMWDGYVCCGIKRDSLQYEWAIKKLEEVELPDTFLINNELLKGYVRVPIVSKKDINNLLIVRNINSGGVNIPIHIPLNDKQKAVVKEIYEKKDITPQLIQTVQENFKNKLLTYEAIKKSQVWWNQLKPYFQITSIGKAIAHANAKRINQSLPDLD